MFVFIIIINSVHSQFFINLMLAILQKSHSCALQTILHAFSPFPVQLKDNRPFGCSWLKTQERKGGFRITCKKVPWSHDIKQSEDFHRGAASRKRSQWRRTAINVDSKSDRSLFGRITVMTQYRDLKMSEILSHPLWPLPWSLATPDGQLRKTKATLATHFQKIYRPWITQR